MVSVEWYARMQQPQEKSANSRFIDSLAPSKRQDKIGHLVLVGDAAALKLWKQKTKSLLFGSGAHPKVNSTWNSLVSWLLHCNARLHKGNENSIHHRALHRWTASRPPVLHAHTIGRGVNWLLLSPIVVILSSDLIKTAFRLNELRFARSRPMQLRQSRPSCQSFLMDFRLQCRCDDV